MKLLLSSAGIKNTSIHDTLVDLLGKEDFVFWKPPTGGDETLGIVDFSICPHLAQENMPGNSMAEAERWAAGIPGPAYAIDDQTAIKVTDGAVEVVSEGHWRLFTPNP